MAAELSFDIADASAKVASWSKERVCVEVKSGDETLPAVIKKVYSDNTALVELADNSLVKVRLADVSRTVPEKNDIVLVIGGKYSGVEGEVVDVYGHIASVKDYDDACRFVDLIDLAIICKEDQQYDPFNGDDPLKVDWKFSLLDDKATISNSKTSSDSVSNQGGQNVKVPRLSLLALTAAINAFEESSVSTCPVMKYHLEWVCTAKSAVVKIQSFYWQYVHDEDTDNYWDYDYDDDYGDSYGVDYSDCYSDDCSYVKSFYDYADRDY